MKRTVKVIISAILALILSASLCISVFAEGENPFADQDVVIGQGAAGDAQNGAEGADNGGDEDDDPFDGNAINVPSDVFEGDYAEFKGSDGSVTAVFDNGSVMTVYPDGTTKGVDYMGNEHVEDKDGNSTIRGTDGSAATNYKDGRMSYKDPDGKTTTINTDGSFSESYERLDVTVDYNADGHCTGIGFVGSDERIGTDEYGDYLDGKITGPNGAVMEVSNNGQDLHLVTPNGTKADMTTTGVSDSKDGCTQTFTMTWKDGSSTKSTVNTKANRDSDGIFTGNSLDVYGNWIADDGRKWEYETKADFDKNGDPTVLGQNVTQFTDSDGATIWRDLNSNAWEFRDPSTGIKVIVNKDGDVTEYNDGKGNEWEASFDDDGNVRSADMRFDDGVKIKVNPDGSTILTMPDGTRYTSPQKGTVYKNGVQIRKDGEWVTGYEPDSNDNKIFGEQTEVDNSGPISEEEIIGTWSVSATFSDIDSPIVGWLTSFFEGILGEMGEGVVEPSIGPDSVVEASQTLVIERGDGADLRVTLYSEDTSDVYKGRLINDVLKLKIVSSGGGEGDAIEIPVDKLEYTFKRSGDSVVIDGSYRINTFLLKATYTAVGSKSSD